MSKFAKNFKAWSATQGVRPRPCLRDSSNSTTKHNIIMSSSTLGIILGIIYAIVSIALIVRVKKLYYRVPLALIAVLAVTFSFVSQSNFASFVFLICFALEAIALACTLNNSFLKIVLWILAVILLIIPVTMLFTKGVEACLDFLNQHKMLGVIIGITIITSFFGTKFLSGSGTSSSPAPKGFHTVEGGGLRSFNTREEAEKWAEQNNIDKSKVQ